MGWPPWIGRSGLGSRLKAAREARGWTRAELAAAATQGLAAQGARRRVEAHAVAVLEEDPLVPLDVPQAAALAAALDMPVEELLGVEDGMMEEAMRLMA